jgi:phosphate/sulfate permease
VVCVLLSAACCIATWISDHHVPQALSWLVAPFLAGVFSCFLFFVVRTFVLRSKNAYQRSLFVLPIFTFLTFFTVTWFTMVK